MDDEKICTSCLARQATSYSYWCRPCINAGQKRRRKRDQMILRNLPRALADRKAATEAMRDTAFRAGELIRQKDDLKSKRLALTPKRRRGLPSAHQMVRPIGKALLELRQRSGLCSCGTWGEELKFLGLSRSMAKYYMDAYVRGLKAKDPV